MSRRRNQSTGSQVANQLRDYAVPLIGLLLVMFIVYNAFSGGEPEIEGDTNTTDTQTETTSSNKMTLDFDSEDTTGSVVYSGGSKDKLEGKNELYPGEKLVIDTGEITLKSAEGLLMKLNKNGELKYDLNGDYLLSSSDLFVKSTDAINMNLRFVNLKLLPGAIVSLNQNEVASTVNVLAGKVEVASFAGKQVSLKGGERLSVSNAEATKEDLDLVAQKEEIGNYFFSETWALDNDLISYLDTTEEDAESATGSTTEESEGGPVIIKKGEYVNFVGLEDNKTYGSSTVDISGELVSERVSKITFNGKASSVNLVGKTFELKGFAIPLLENDIVYKIYDAGDNVLERGVYTVYYKEGAEAATTETATATATNATDFPVNDSDPQFTFTAPSPNPYTTTAAFVTIRGTASAGVASSVTVNGLKLNSFNGTTWRYHAAIQFGTLKNGVNLYKVNYYDTAGAVVHTNTFTIIRKVVTAPVAATPAKVITPIPVAAASTTEVVAEESDAVASGGDSIADRIPLD